MLTLTEEATTAVKTITAQLPDAAEGGVRIEGAGSPESPFGLSVVDAPESGDAVVENAGARVYLDTDAAAVLDDRVLDAQIDPEQGSVQFAVTGAA
ncbi:MULTISPECIES: Fe-S cluster assembly protein HesB [Microbacterium]|uniref:Fe-S cluster assembly protein HesB n=1 Tax=Microbacterium TaxID=33882 RepID=UPI00278AF1AA|nr:MULTISPECIES: Fe-S cluster assembly protein HesB [Microbacterium]MDQ1084584.1 iron-sulfur cluster assembly protein [Microbacterium sp. SORGH_AS_0344]MDQ1170138.1 iron-sulfur cluster assembly protein [Microbacterium proteolyticum]